MLLRIEEFTDMKSNVTLEIQNETGHGICKIQAHTLSKKSSIIR